MPGDAIDDYALLRLVEKVLRQKQDVTGLTPDSHGWVDIDQLCTAIRTGWPNAIGIETARLGELHGRLKTAQRVYDLETGRVRRRYARNFHGRPGHPSIDVVPEQLFHSADREGSTEILRDGLIASKGATIVLAQSVDDAQDRALQRTRGDEAVFIVDTDAARALGVEFFVVNDDQFLAERVPAAALSIWQERAVDPPLISPQEALRIAEAVLELERGGLDLRLVGPIDRPRHWVWSFNAVEYLDGDGAPLAGLSSIAISKTDGNVRRLWSGRSIEDQV